MRSVTVSERARMSEGAKLSRRTERRPQYQMVYLVLCLPCTARVESALEKSPARDPNTAPRELCDDCTAKAAQALRLLVSSHLDARIAIPWGHR